MKIVAFGDSWVWGDELSDDNVEKRESVNITGLIRNHYNIETLNFSVNGGSLDEILFQLMIYFESDLYNPNDLILIGLTSPVRYFHYNNILKSGLRFPSWDYNSFKNWGDKKLTNQEDYKTWWNLNLKYNINGNNDILNYTKCVLSIKSLLSNYSNRYIVWQSIDGQMYDFIDKTFEPLMFWYYNSNEQVHDEPCKVFDKFYLNKILNKGTTDKQVWLNIIEPSWKEWLENNHNNKDVFFKQNFHPNELGIKLWFEGFLKKYIDNNLDI